MSKLQQLEVLWEEVSQKKMFQFKDFFVDFYLTQKYDLTFIDPNKMDVQIVPLRVPDCANCQHNCCRGAENTVSLRLKDIATLLDNGLDQYIDRNNHVVFESEYLKKRPLLRWNLKSDSWKKFPVLKRVNDICPLLGKNNECTIHAVRPLVCKRFPFTVRPNLKQMYYSASCPTTKTVEAPNSYAKEHIQAAIDVYNEKVKDLILIHKAKAQLKEIGLWQYLVTK